MVTRNLYVIYDTVSETFVSQFIAPNDKSAKRNYDQFLKATNMDTEDFKLAVVCNVDCPVSKEDVKDVQFLLEED